MGSWLSTGDLTAPRRPPTPPEREAIAEVLAVAVEFDGTTGALAAARLATTPRQRNLTAMFTVPADPAFRPLMRLLDALIATGTTDDGDAVPTKHGIFSRRDLVEAEVRVERDGGNELIVFPVRLPWRRKPDEHGDGGDRGPAIYRSREERKPEIGSFGVGVQARPAADRIREWWEDDGGPREMVAVGFAAGEGGTA